MFAGNIGEAQDFESILKAAFILSSNKRIHWIILGDGRKKQWVVEQIDKKNLNNCFHLLGSYPLDMMPSFYSEADCMLFSLKKDYIFSLTIPAKVQSYLACGKPIVSMIDGEASIIINDSKAGLTAPSEDPERLAENILQLSKLDKKSIDKLGENALNYYNENFERTMLIDRLEKMFKNLISLNKNIP